MYILNLIFFIVISCIKTNHFSKSLVKGIVHTSRVNTLTEINFDLIEKLKWKS